MHHCGRMHARLITWWFTEKLQSVRESEIRILAAQQGRRNSREFLGNDYGGSPRSPCRPGILGIGHEGKLSRPCIFDAGHPGNFDLGRTIFQARVESSSNLSEFHRHYPEIAGGTVIVTEAVLGRKRARLRMQHSWRSLGSPAYFAVKHSRKAGRDPSLVLVPGPVFLAAKLAISWRQAVVHSMFHGRQSSQISEHGFQIVIREVGEFSEGHDRRQFSCLHISGAHDLDEQCLVVVADSGRRRE